MKFKDLINEEEYVDIQKVNFKQMYDEFNRKYFENKLPNIPILIKPLKSFGGRVLVFGYPKSNKVGHIIGLHMSSFLKSSLERYKAILAHEMIHVYVHSVLGIFQDEGDPSHGKHFKEKLRELNTKTPFKIPLGDELDDREEEVSDSVKRKKYYVVIRIDNTKQNDKKINIFSKELNFDELEILRNIAFENKNVSFEYYVSDEKGLLTYKPSPKSVLYKSQWYSMDNGLYNTIKENGKPHTIITPTPSVIRYLTLDSKEREYWRSMGYVKPRANKIHDYLIKNKLI